MHHLGGLQLHRFFYQGNQSIMGTVCVLFCRSGRFLTSRWLYRRHDGITVYLLSVVGKTTHAGRAIIMGVAEIALWVEVIVIFRCCVR